MVFLKKPVDLDRLKPVFIAGKMFDYVSSVTYLGTKITSEEGFGFSSSDDLLSFYRASNSILNVVSGPSQHVLMHLLYANCIPTLTYACAVKEYPARQMIDCNPAVNDAIRKIFTYNRWESVRDLRRSYGYNSLSEIFSSAKKRFHDQLSNHQNGTIRSLALLSSVE